MAEHQQRVRWPAKFWKEGFDGRIFLTEEEWRTYLRRAPVRYPRRTMPPRKVCGVCGRRGPKSNPLQVAHRISFIDGVRFLALTPDFLDDPKNLTWAHRKTCNRVLELDVLAAMRQLRALGVPDLPAFLSAESRALWRSLG